MSPTARPRARHLLAAVAAAVVLLVAAPAQAKDLLDYVIEAVDPTLAPARPLIECLAGGGDAIACATEAAAKQGKGALTIGAGDDRIKKTVAVLLAARDERWFDVVKIGGEVVAKSIACAVLPVQGPAKGPVCDVVGWLVSSAAKDLDKAYQILKGPDWWALVDLLGSQVCTFMPGGAAKDVLCGALATVLLEAKATAEKLAAAAAAGVDALESFVFGDDSHMPYDRYYALYWQPWYHYAVDLRLQDQSIGALAASIYGPCVDYFDSHNQYRKTAKKTCGNFKNQRFLPQVEAFAKALPVAVAGYFESVARPAIRAAVRASYGKPSQKDLPGQKFFEQNCAFQMRARFPFPEPDPDRCALIANRAKKYPMFKSGFTMLAKACATRAVKQAPQPTAWARACTGLAPSYQQAFAGEALKLIAAIGKLKSKGCSPGDAKQVGLRLICVDHIGYAACLTELAPGGAKHCRVEVAVATKATPAGGHTVGKPVEPSQPAQPSRGDPTASGLVNAEAEELLAGKQLEAKGGTVAAQAMAGFGAGWSGDQQVLWRATEVGATLDLIVEVPRRGRYAVELYLARAPDYGQLQLEVDGQRSAVPFDGFAPSVMAPTPLQVGTFALEAGPRRLRLRVIGRYQDATGYLVGVDRVRLYWSGDR